MAEMVLPSIAAQMHSGRRRKSTALQNVSQERCECHGTVPARFAKAYEDDLPPFVVFCDELRQLLLHAREQRGEHLFAEQCLQNVDILTSVSSVRWIVERETIDPQIDRANEGRLFLVDFRLQRRHVAIVCSVPPTQIRKAELDNTARRNLNYEAMRRSRPCLWWQTRWNTGDT